MVKGRQRVESYTTFNDLVNKICFSQTQKYATLLSLQKYSAINKNYCSIMKTQFFFRQTYVSSGVVKNFKYKKYINNGCGFYIFFITIKYLLF